MTAPCEHDLCTSKLDRTFGGRRTADRCLHCGHRANDLNRSGRPIPARQTRYTPRRWLTELPRRIAARRMGTRIAARAAERNL